jgi:hypothetical protein
MASDMNKRVMFPAKVDISQVMFCFVNSLMDGQRKYVSQPLIHFSHQLILNSKSIIGLARLVQSKNKEKKKKKTKKKEKKKIPSPWPRSMSFASRAAFQH